MKRYVAYTRKKHGINLMIEPGKEYDIKIVNENKHALAGRSFNLNINNQEFYCLERNCAHLGGGNWIIKEAKQ